MDSTTENLIPNPSATGNAEGSAIGSKIPLSARHPHVTRTERGLVVRGTRLTLYDVWERRLNGHSDTTIAQWYHLMPEQVSDAFSYIQDNQQEFDAEYAAVVNNAEEKQAAWQAANRERLADIANMPPPPGKEEAFARLRALQAELRGQ